MGAYSSWGLFSLSHHFVVQLAARNSGFEGWYHGYMLLGDDIVLFGDSPLAHSIANEYVRLLAIMGVTVNPSKGVVSANGTFEFAKKIVYKGSVVTIFHWKEWSRINSISGLASFLKRLSDERGISFSLSTVWAVVAEMFPCTPHFAEVRLPELIRKAVAGETIPLTVPIPRPFRVVTDLLTSPFSVLHLPMMDWKSKPVWHTLLRLNTDNVAPHGPEGNYWNSFYNPFAYMKRWEIERTIAPLVQLRRDFRQRFINSLLRPDDIVQWMISSLESTFFSPHAP
jgi:hypothetical protein